MSWQAIHPDHIDNDIVPLYTETDEDGLLAWAESLQIRADDLQLPLTRFPGHNFNRQELVRARRAATDDAAVAEQVQIHDMQLQLVHSFFSAITTKKPEVVAMMINRGIVSPDIPDLLEFTPLLAAVNVGDATMVRTLLNLGATVDGYGLFGDKRTPLQLAASKGNLTIVRLLMEEYGADDSLIAPDGQLALRLAAEGGHREVVEYLPARRGGEWRRWKVHHEKSWMRIKKAMRKIVWFFRIALWEVPRCLVWTAPKHLIILPIRDGGKHAWKHRREFIPWCKRKAKEAGKEIVRLPGRVARAARSAFRATWRGIKNIPSAIKIAFDWIWESLKKMGHSVASIALRFLSLLHTMVAAIADFFRSITLQDIWNGICALFRAIFIDFPQAVWSGIKAFGEASYRVLGKLFGWMGKAFWWIVTGLLYVVQYVPKELWNILKWLWSSIAKGYHEIMVWVDPKR